MIPNNDNNLNLNNEKYNGDNNNANDNKLYNHTNIFPKNINNVDDDNDNDNI